MFLSTEGVNREVLFMFGSGFFGGISYLNLFDMRKTIPGCR